MTRSRPVAPPDTGSDDALTLAVGDTEFVVMPGLGLVGSSLRVAGREFLRFDARAVHDGHTSGIPLLAPWANRLRGPSYEIAGERVSVVGAPGVHLDDAGLPIHGTMVGRDGWIVETSGASASPTSMRSTFDAGACAEVLASFPFRHEITVVHQLAPGRLTITTEIHATGDRAVPVSFGWHPYLRLPASGRASWSLELPDRHHLVLDDRQLPTGEERFEPAERVSLDGRSFDDGYRADPGSSFALTDGSDRIEMQLGEGYTHAQVFAPVASNLVALEPMTAATDSLSVGTTPMVEPGHRQTATFTISIS